MIIKKRTHVQVTTFWGNEDAVACIKVSRRRWSTILKGESYETRSYSYYEGTRSIVLWCFEKSKLTIVGADNVEYVNGIDVTKLNTCVIGQDV